MSLGEWDPLTVPETAALLGDCGAPWWIAGGWAIDLQLGYDSRAHADIDVLMLRCDQHTLREHLAGWDVYAADPPGGTGRWGRHCQHTSTTSGVVVPRLGRGRCN